MLIEKALKEIDNIAIKSKFYNDEHPLLINIKKVLCLLKNQLEINENPINMIVLRAMHNLGIYAFKDFENNQLVHHETTFNCDLWPYGTALWGLRQKSKPSP
jgi:hypothetical protein